MQALFKDTWGDYWSIEEVKEFRNDGTVKISINRGIGGSDIITRLEDIIIK